MNDFELPPGAATKPRGKAAAKPVETQLQDQLDKVKPAEDGAGKTPVKPKWSQDELLAIFDEIIFSGTYSETVDIRGRLKVKFRTRTAEETEAITDSLDATSANLISTMNEKRMVLNLYYALETYQGKDLSMLKQVEKESFVGKLPAVVVGALIKALSEFDQKTYAACVEGEENF